MVAIAAQLTSAQAAELLLKRERMMGSLLGFAENIEIPGAPQEGDEILDLEDEWGAHTAEEGPDGKTVWKEAAAPKLWTPGNVFDPVGSMMAHHHRVLCEALQRTMLRRYGRLIVLMPPGAAKSTYCTVVGPSWYIHRFARRRIILASYATPLAAKHGAKARQVAGQALVRGCFGTALSKDTSAKEMWSLTNGSEYMSGGLLAGITGNRAHGVICDDPIKGREAADSEAIRRATWDAWSDDLMTRLIPGGFVILVQTRWSHEDVAGKLLGRGYDGRSGPVMCTDGRVWEVLNIPAECERSDDPLGRPIGDGKGGVPGSMLWPEWFDAEHWVQFRKRPRTWAALFQQRPDADELKQFRMEWFEGGTTTHIGENGVATELHHECTRYTLGEAPRWLNKYTASDYATGDDEGDNTEHGQWGLDADGHLWALDWWHAQKPTDIGMNALLDMARLHKCRNGFSESGVIKKAIGPFWEEAQVHRKWPMNITYLPTVGQGNKAARCKSFREMCEAGRVHIPRCDWGDRLVAQLLAFPDHGVPDDAVDVCGLIGRGLEEMVWSRVEEPTPLPPELVPFTVAWLEYGTQPDDKPVGGRRI